MLRMLLYVFTYWVNHYNTIQMHRNFVPGAFLTKIILIIRKMCKYTKSSIQGNIHKLHGDCFAFWNDHCCLWCHFLQIGHSLQLHWEQSWKISIFCRNTDLLSKFWHDFSKCSKSFDRFVLNSWNRPYALNIFRHLQSCNLSKF